MNESDVVDCGHRFCPINVAVKKPCRTGVEDGVSIALHDEGWDI